VILCQYTMSQFWLTKMEYTYNPQFLQILHYVRLRQVTQNVGIRSCTHFRLACLSDAVESVAIVTYIMVVLALVMHALFYSVVITYS